MQVQYKPNPEFLDSMSVERRKAWHDALISGEYEQGNNMLFDDGFYCCLGVYCHILGINKKSLSVQTPDEVLEVNRDDEIFSQGNFGNPYIAVLDDDDPSMNGMKFQASEMNDFASLSFAEIAKLIYPEAYNKVSVTGNSF